MSRRSTVRTLLPEKVRAELDRRLIRGDFGSHGELREWLLESGFEISRSALHRYGSVMEKRIEQIRIATVQAEALVSAAPDDTWAVADATLRLVQEKIFELMLAAEDGDLGQLSSAARALAAVSRAGTSIRQDRRRALKEAAEAAGKAAKKQGLSENGAAAIRAAVEGASE